jgi:hypothetical protein
MQHVKYFGTGKGADPFRELQGAYLYDSLEECVRADEKEFTAEEMAGFQYYRVMVVPVEVRGKVK